MSDPWIGLEQRDQAEAERPRWSGDGDDQVGLRRAATDRNYREGDARSSVQSVQLVPVLAT